jgi:hypothetical protein
VAGIVAAGINGVGHAGLCPTCKIMPIKVLNSSNQGTWSVVAAASSTQWNMAPKSST